MNSPSRTYSIAVSGVPGFRTTPALAPKPFIWVIRKNTVKKVQVGTLKLGKNLQIRFVIPTPTSLSLPHLAEQWNKEVDTEKQTRMMEIKTFKAGLCITLPDLWIQRQTHTTPPPNTPLLSFRLVVQRTKYYKQNFILLLFWLYHYYNAHKYQHRPRKNHTWLTVRCKWMVEACSQWTLTMSAPALIKSGTRCSGSTIICRILIPYEQFFWGLYNDPIGRNKRRKDYQMYIQRKICYRTQGIDHKRSNCNVWNKTTIHDINMNPITTSQLHCFYLDKVREKC